MPRTLRLLWRGARNQTGDLFLAPHAFGRPAEVAGRLVLRAAPRRADRLAKAPAEGLALASPNRAAPTSLARGLPGKRLVEGVVNGRNIWINDYEQSLATLGTLLGLADRVVVSASCSLLHVPLDATVERDMAPQIARRLAFARQTSAPLASARAGTQPPTDRPTWGNDYGGGRSGGGVSELGELFGDDVGRGSGLPRVSWALCL